MSAEPRGEDPGRIVSASGVLMPRIIYGTAWKKERTAALVEEALRTGFRGIDTACQPKHYNEPGVGEGLAAALGAGLDRADIYLQTKFTPFGGQDPENIPYDAEAAIGEQVRQSFEVSLRNLRVDRLDGLVLHSPYPEDKDTLEAWRAMESLVAQGGVRQLGVSNCYELSRLKMLWKKARVKPAVIQNRFYAKTGYDREIRAFCAKHKIFYQSFWTLTANPETLAKPELVALAEKYERGRAQIFFRFLTQQGILCLTGTSSQEHMRDDLAIFDFSLTAEECATLDALLTAAPA
ncbi:diketogulonate reductase-like aldo/keto reductase [Methylosinus sp. sav-2]|uniref:aldo/keto reductase family protein n=1 Tax=Methylosinus sp. sav-2 TaxID=2485168 RepID=UPI000478A21F|nr:aldo/keto reductase [Methylosinus sp. sav-2]TDX66850.1 diketogulonate reductase-like aldo/keto reductase [Methylosinus sp. sav-2]